MKKLVALSCLLLLIQPIEVVGKDVKGNQTIESFNKAKKLLENKVIFDQRLTIYCQAPFDDKKMINLPKDFQAPNHQSRSSRVEWEHIVPAENFGRFFLSGEKAHKTVWIIGEGHSKGASAQKR